MAAIEGPVGFHMRIGELSRRVGVGHDTLRAWERRYGLLQPRRSTGGYRLYSADDEARVRTMRRHMERGMAPAEAARAALGSTGAAAPTEVPQGDPMTALRVALEEFREADAQVLLDRLLGTMELEAVLQHVVMPYLRDLGERWADGRVSIPQEHFATHVLRGRLMQLARDWDGGDGPRAVLACPSGELHDLPLVCLGLALRQRGWRVTFLGADTPAQTLLDMVRRLAPDAVVLSSYRRELFTPHAQVLGDLASRVPTVLAGPGACPRLARDTGCGAEPGDPVSAAHRLTSLAGAA